MGREVQLYVYTIMPPPLCPQFKKPHLLSKEKKYTHTHKRYLHQLNACFNGGGGDYNNGENRMFFPPHLNCPLVLEEYLQSFHLVLRVS